MRRAITSAVLVLFCGCAPTPQPQVDPGRRDSQADYAASLFIDSCVRHLTQPVELLGWIRKNGLRELEPSLQSRFLHGQEGQVWSSATSLGAFFLIVVPLDEETKASKCSVWAHRADATRVTERFERLLKDTARADLRVGRVSDRELEGAGGTYRQLVYFLQKIGAGAGFLFIATTSASEEAEIQARLTVSPSQPPPGFEGSP